MIHSEAGARVSHPQHTEWHFASSTTSGTSILDFWRRPPRAALQRSQKVVMSLLLLVLLASATASPLGRMQLCGSELANKLAEMCAVYGYNDPFRHAHYEDSTYESITPTRTRVKRGVADECCKMGCSQETLEQYCNPPLKPSGRSKVLKVSEDHSINHIPQDDSAATAVLTSEARRSSIAREEKNDLVSKGDLEELERHLNKIAPVIGTINPSYLGIPVILPPRIRKEEMPLQDYGTK